MQNSRGNALPFIVGIATSIGVALFAASIHDANVNSFERWVRDYQTLISGLAAIFAAYVTVAQMRGSDERQEQRHRELVDLGRRHEKLAVSRFGATVAPLFNRTASHLSEFVALYADRDEPEWDEETIKKYHFALMGLLVTRDAITGPNTQDCRHLMPADLSYLLLSCSVFIDRVIARTIKDASVASFEIVEVDQLQQWFRDGAADAFSDLSQRLKTLSDRCASWVVAESSTTSNRS